MLLSGAPLRIILAVSIAALLIAPEEGTFELHVR